MVLQQASSLTLFLRNSLKNAYFSQFYSYYTGFILSFNYSRHLSSSSSSEQFCSSQAGRLEAIGEPKKVIQAWLTFKILTCENIVTMSLLCPGTCCLLETRVVNALI